MTKILCLETSGLSCSVALAGNGSCLAQTMVADDQYRHAEVLHSLILKNLDEAKSTLKTLDAIAVSMGPGSYTGLRVGVTAAKGLCYGLNIPLIAINSLEIIATGAQRLKQASKYIAMIDARRDEVFLQEFDASVQKISEAKPVVFPDYQPGEGDIVLCGSGSEKAKRFFQNKQLLFLPEVQPEAKNMCALAQESFSQKKFVDVAYFEPFYLKEFYTGKK
jgi:tRNA threonylcarbamoyladenosine biosynthesis protein TsaB